MSTAQAMHFGGIMRHLVQTLDAHKIPQLSGIQAAENSLIYTYIYIQYICIQYTVCMCICVCVKDLYAYNNDGQLLIEYNMYIYIIILLLILLLYIYVCVCVHLGDSGDGEIHLHFAHLVPWRLRHGRDRGCRIRAPPRAVPNEKKNVNMGK